jgi:hypothetical protein
MRSMIALSGTNFVFGIRTSRAALNSIAVRSPSRPIWPVAKPRSLSILAQASAVFVTEEPGRSAYSRPMAPICQIWSSPTGSPPGGKRTDWVKKESRIISLSLSVGMMSTPSRIQSQM